MGQTSCPATCICNSAKDDYELGQTPRNKSAKSLKIRPLLCDLEEEFKKHADKSGTIDASKLADIWKKSAQKKVGQLTPQDVEMISSSAEEYISVMDMDKNGRIDHSEFFTYMLGGLDARGPFRQMRESLRERVAKDPKALQLMMQDFQHWDANGDGTISREELHEKMKTLSKDGASTSESDPAFVERLVNAMDVDKDGLIDLWEFIAYSLGRRKTPVELLLYDISHGLSQRWSPILLGRSFEAIYHSSTIVHGHEFWYGGQLFMNDPPIRQVFGDPLSKSHKVELTPSTYKQSLMSYHIGYTLNTMDEIMYYLSGDINKKYTKDNYDVMTHNCNCFSHEFTQFLTGEGIPDAVRKLPELVMETPTAYLMRPLLNRWLGGFTHSGAQQNTQDPHGFEYGPAKSDVQELPLDTVCDGFLQSEGGVVGVDLGLLDGTESSGETQIAQVTRSGKDTVDIRYFDPESCSFIERKDVAKNLCQPVSVSEHKDEMQSLAVLTAMNTAASLDSGTSAKDSAHSTPHKHPDKHTGILGKFTDRLEDMNKEIKGEKAHIRKMMKDHGKLLRKPTGELGSEKKDKQCREIQQVLH